MQAQQKVNVVMDTPAGEPSQTQTKPKRVLTEAQRLAFLKGREKRMANIERKRQEKLEAESEGIVQPPTKKKRTSKKAVKEPEQEIKKEETIPDTSNDESDSNEEPLLDIKEPEDTTNEEDDDYHDIAAKKIADYVYDRMLMLKESEKTVKDSPDPETKPKRKYERKAKPSSPEQQATSRQFSHVAPIPQRAFSWM